ncbi:hypothetical protein HY969_01785 [Candidatus Kaiserbacteria bacterium]|nr:hypothetical protein [Candidatus Kaiserbacteria bacterium]
MDKRNYKNFFGGNRITVMGLGLLGRGVGDVEFIASLAKEVLVTDKKTEAELKESVERLKRFSNISFRLGEHRKEDFTNCDLVIKAAGVPLDSPYIAAAHTAGIPVYMSTALFAKFASEIGAILVGVTGTRGKSTTAHLIYHTLMHAGMRAHFGGNVRGKSTLAMIPEIKKGDIVVLELDSWQLQGFGDLKISPHIAIFTNLYPDHQNYYSSMEAYFSDKANIFAHQHEGDVLIVGKEIEEKILNSHPPVHPVAPSLSDSVKLKIRGEHNRMNAALADAALDALHVPEVLIKKGLASFEGVEGRLQYIGSVNGIAVFNDNSATTPEATIAALRVLGSSHPPSHKASEGQRKNVVLIIGGDDKKLDMSKLIDEIPMWCSKVVLFKERGTDTIRDKILAMKEKGIDVYEEEGLDATINRAFEIAKPGETVLYSPAFSSFGKYFKNEFDRGDQFMRLAKNLGVSI